MNREDPGGLTAIDTHPVQYRAPVYRLLQQRFGVPVTAIYGSDAGVRPYYDAEFRTQFAWDSDLLSGYRPIFLSAKTRLASELRRQQPAAVLISGFAQGMEWRGIVECLKAGYPMLYRGEATDHTRVRWMAHRGLRDAILRRFYKRCARLLYIGQRSQLHFKRLGVDEKKLIFSPYAVDTAPFRSSETDRATLRPAARADLGIPADGWGFLFSGKLSPRKGPDLLIQAAKRLPPEVRGKTVLIFLGDGELRGKLQAAARSEPSVTARFLGFRNQSQMSPVFHASDLLVLPSLHSETWGLVVNEALHHGLPCAVSEDVGCAPDLIHSGVTGEISQAGSAPSLCQAIQKARAWINGEEVGRRCREIADRYGLEKAAAGIARAFEEVRSMNKGLLR